MILSEAQGRSHITSTIYGSFSGTVETSAGHRNRIVSIDAFRFLAIIVIIFNHAAVGVLSRPVIGCFMFGVPFVFMVAGYFLASRAARTGSIAKLCRRQLIPFAFWLAFYLLWFHPPVAQFEQTRFLVSLVIRGGPAYHLWFLPSLTLCSVMLLAGLQYGIRLWTLAIIAAILYLAGMAFGDYYPLLTGHRVFPLWNTRNGPFFGFPFLVAGVLMARSQSLPGLKWSVAIFVSGLSLRALEIAWLTRHGAFYRNELLLGTLPTAIGFFLMARSVPGVWVPQQFALLGRYTLGIYSVHAFFLDLLQRTLWRGASISVGAMAGCLALVILTAVMSSASCVWLGRVRWFSPLVR